MTRITLGIVAALALSAAFPAVPAHAQNGSLTRSFVSSTGSNTNPCTITLPCQSFAQAYTAIGANGIVAALDPGKYGPLTISGPVTINGNGWAAVTAAAGSTGITINAGSGDVTLTGLEIDGAGTAYNGIADYSAGNLTVTNCTLQNFVTNPLSGGYGNGILVEPASGHSKVLLRGIIVLNAGNAGIYVTPHSGAFVNASIDGVTVNNNQYGIYVDSASTTASELLFEITGTHADNNTNTGITLNSASSTGSQTVGTIKDSTASMNGQNGIAVSGSQTFVQFSHCIVDNEFYGILLSGNAAAVSDGTNNVYDLYGVGVSGGSLVSAPPQ
jgi:Right handed beta helix region